MKYENVLNTSLLNLPQMITEKDPYFRTVLPIKAYANL